VSVRSRPDTRDVIIVGGGLIGCSIAWQLALRGLRVRVLERDVPAQSASWAAAGMLSPIGEFVSADPLRELADASFDLYPHFVDAVRDSTGIDPQLARSGKIHVAFTDSEFEQARVAFAGVAGATVLSREEVHALEPAVHDAAAGGVLVERDHHVDNRLLGRAVWLAAARAGVTFTNGAAVAAVERDGDAIAGVRLATGDFIASRFVIVAAGAWSGRIAGLPQLPVVPVRGQMCALEAVPPPLTHMVAARGVYIIPRANGRVLIGATLEHVGFRNECTAAGVRALTDGAIEAVPALADARFAEFWSGLRPGTADELPILGHDPETSGLLYATGHYRNGILLAPISAEIICDLVIGQATRMNIEPFRVDRFRGGTDAA